MWPARGITCWGDDGGFVFATEKMGGFVLFQLDRGTGSRKESFQPHKLSKSTTFRLGRKVYLGVHLVDTIGP